VGDPAFNHDPVGHIPAIRTYANRSRNRLIPDPANSHKDPLLCPFTAGNVDRDRRRPEQRFDGEPEYRSQGERRVNSGKVPACLDRPHHLAANAGPKGQIVLTEPRCFPCGAKRCAPHARNLASKPGFWQEPGLASTSPARPGKHLRTLGVVSPGMADE
jgi:hypothetical protein